MYNYFCNRYEAQNCPDVVVAKIDPDKMKKKKSDKVQVMMFK